MKDIEIIRKGNLLLVDSKLLYHTLNVASQHKDWIRRRIENYGFIENQDYYMQQCSTLSGGSKRKDYLLTTDMAKELAMLENNETGKEVRKYFIKRDKELNTLEAKRLASIQVRKDLTDVIQESGENERQHGRAYSNFTRLTYSLTGLTEKYKNYTNKSGFRDSLSKEELERVELVESLIKPLLKLNKDYSEIKQSLLPLFKTKELI